eukprot:TRINITY_DN752_c0_g1_i1.p1 TRINITY_DN752_c0_g1~~TRINITY_DN752_c0_g1_i1.p1  ORF type:complete len:205 (+),score=37.30 TRINITY_DN752_c0_g1_i1:49-615(+)
MEHLAEIQAVTPVSVKSLQQQAARCPAEDKENRLNEVQFTQRRRQPLAGRVFSAKPLADVAGKMETQRGFSSKSAFQHSARPEAVEKLRAIVPYQFENDAEPTVPTTDVLFGHVRCETPDCETGFVSLQAYAPQDLSGLDYSLMESADDASEETDDEGELGEGLLEISPASTRDGAANPVSRLFLSLF